MANFPRRIFNTALFKEIRVARMKMQAAAIAATAPHTTGRRWVTSRAMNSLGRIAMTKRSQRSYAIGEATRFKIGKRSFLRPRYDGRLAGRDWREAFRED